MNRRVNRPAGRSISRPAPRPAARIQRPAPSVRRSINPVRSNQQTLRQSGLRQQAQRNSVLRPAVRPTAAPRRIMPARPAPPAVRSVPAQSERRAMRPAAFPRPASMPVRQGGKPGAVPAPQARRVGRPAPAAGRAAQMPAKGVPLSPAAFNLNVGAAHPQLGPEVSALQYSLSTLQQLSTFDDLSADLQELDSALNHALSLLESARDKGYRYQKDLDELAQQTASAWQQIYDETQADIEREAGSFQSTLQPLGAQVPQLNARLNNPAAAAPILRSTETTVNGLLQDVQARRSSLQARYAEVQSNTYLLTGRLTAIHWMLGQLGEAKFGLQDGENLVMAVKARWDQAGEDDPEGILFLTDKRLVFERKEQVATKKILFITTSKELVQEVLFAEAVSGIREQKAQSKGLFGHQDFLEVQFGGGPGQVSLHLDGQDSREWSALIERVRSGKIEEDRAVAGALTFTMLTGEITQADLAAMQAEVNGLQDELMLAEPRAEIEELENEMRQLERDLAELRARGYAVEKSLEADIAVLASQWDRVKTNAQKTLDMQAGVLAGQASTLNELMGRLAGLSGNLAAARPVYMQLKSAIASTEAQAAAAMDTVYGQFDDYAAEVAGLAAHLDWVEWMLEALATASFQLLASESGVAATEALYARPGMEPENGILFLTDQRLLWEDRVGDYELKVNLPLAAVETVRVETLETEGEPDEILVFRFSGAAPYPEGRFDIAAPVGETWVQMVGRARNGDYTTDRAIALDPTELDRIRSAPAQCPNCGAQFTAPILRGQTELTCEFCGVVTRI